MTPAHGTQLGQWYETRAFKAKDLGADLGDLGREIPISKGTASRVRQNNEAGGLLSGEYDKELGMQEVAEKIGGAGFRHGGANRDLQENCETARPA